MPSNQIRPSKPKRLQISRRHLVFAAVLGFATLGYAASSLIPDSDSGPPLPVFPTAANSDFNLKLANQEARLNILFIGNSLTSRNDLPGILEALINSTDFGPVHIESHTRGNFGLGEHWKYSIAPQIIAKGGWDIVVIQQGASATSDSSTLLEYPKLVEDEVTKIVLMKGSSKTEGRPSLLEYSKIINIDVTRQKGRTALFQVWPADIRYRDYDWVCESYRLAAEQIEGMLFPVGEAFRMARKRDANLSLLRGDDYHPNPNGTYLAALVMFQQVTGRSPHGLPAKFQTSRDDIVSIAPETATMLQNVAVEANEKFALH